MICPSDCTVSAPRIGAAEPPCITVGICEHWVEYDDHRPTDVHLDERTQTAVRVVVPCKAESQYALDGILDFLTADPVQARDLLGGCLTDLEVRYPNRVHPEG